jgi:hypothetical protein
VGAEPAPKKIARGLTLLSIASVVGAVIAPLTLGVSSIPAAILLAIAAVLARRGYHVNRHVAVALVSLVITAVTITAWQRFFLAEAEVSGGEVRHHEKTEERFDTAFGKAQAPPPGRSVGPNTDASGGDAGIDFGNDAGR